MKIVGSYHISNNEKIEKCLKLTCHHPLFSQSLELPDVMIAIFIRNFFYRKYARNAEQKHGTYEDESCTSKL